MTEIEDRYFYGTILVLLYIVMLLLDKCCPLTLSYAEWKLITKGVVFNANKNTQDQHEIAILHLCLCTIFCSLII